MSLLFPSLNPQKSEVIFRRHSQNYTARNTHKLVFGTPNIVIFPLDFIILLLLVSGDVTGTIVYEIYHPIY